MHNLHFITTKADTAEDACNIVESAISEWGTENNWRVICGCVSEDNEVYDKQEGRYRPDSDETIQGINQIIENWIKHPTIYAHTAVEKMQTESDFSKWNKHELWSLKEYAQDLYHKKDMPIPFDVLNTDNEFYSWSFDECGVTHLLSEEVGKKYVVFVDMHS
jgi:hypothetical protein